MSVKTRKLAELLAKEAKGTNVLSKREQDDLRQLMERLDVDIAAARNTLTKVVNTTELISLTTQSEVTFSSGGTVDLGGYTLDLGANFTTTGGALQLTSSGSYTLTIAGNASVTGTNTGDDSLATNSGLVLTSHVLNMGTPQSVTSASTNNVTTSTHGHEADSTLARSAINMTAGNGLAAGSGGNLTADRTFTLGTPTTITVSTTNAVTTNSHVHTITSSASVTGETETLLATDSSGVVRLYRVGIGTAPDAQYDLDVAGSIHTSSYFVGRHAIEVKGALMLCHYDGERPWETNFTGEVTGHMGQVGNKAGGLIFRPGAFYKGAQIAEAATNLCTNPSAEIDTTGWTKAQGADSLTRIITDSHIGTACFRSYTANFSINNHYLYMGYLTVSALTNYYLSAWIKKIASPTTGNLNILWYTDIGFISTSVLATFDNGVHDWKRYSGTAISPATATRCRIAINMGTVAGEHDIYFDEVLFVQSDYPVPYLDGSLGDGHVWTGTAHASTSTRTAATLYYANPLVAAEGTIQLHWIPSSANTTAQTSPYLFSEGNLKAYYLAADDKIYFTDGTNTISTDALTFSADLPQFLAFSWSSAGLEIKRYYNSTMDTTVTGATYTAPTLGANLYIGSDTAGANQCNGIIDDLGVIDHLYTDAEFLAIAKSDGPIFAETSTWAFRFGYNRGWSDVDGLWVIDSDSNAVFGVYGGASTKTWGGFTLAPGDIVLGSNVSGSGAILWDASTHKFGFYGNASATVQCEIDTNGTLTAGAGIVGLDSSGMRIRQGYLEENAINGITFCTSTVLDSGNYASIRAWKQEINEGTTRLKIYSCYKMEIEALNIVMSGAITGNSTISTTALLVEQDGVKDNVLVVDTTNGAVGINTAAVSGTALTVGGGSIGDGGKCLRLNISRAWEFQQENADGAGASLRLRDLNTNKSFFIDTSGVFAVRKVDASATIAYFDCANNRLGLGGDTSPAEVLDVTGNINCTGVYKVDDVQVVGPQIVDSRINDNIAETYGTSEANVLKALRAWATTWGAVVPS